MCSVLWCFVWKEIPCAYTFLTFLLLTYFFPFLLFLCHLLISTFFSFLTSATSSYHHHFISLTTQKSLHSSRRQIVGSRFYNEMMMWVGFYPRLPYNFSYIPSRINTCHFFSLANLNFFFSFLSLFLIYIFKKFSSFIGLDIIIACRPILKYWHKSEPNHSIIFLAFERTRRSVQSYCYLQLSLWSDHHHRPPPHNSLLFCDFYSLFRIMWNCRKRKKSRWKS